MNIVTLGTGLVLALPLTAQITIGEADMPGAGDTLRYRNGATLELDDADTGADHLWDFSTLQPLAEGADTLVSVTSTPFLYQFFFNNPFLYPEHRADHAVRGANMDLQVVSFEELYDYYATDEDAHRNVGFGATINGLPASVQRDPIDVVHRFPMEFGNSDSSASAFEIALPGLGYFGQQQVRRNVVDGWGTLILPADTFEVLRVKSRIERADTIYIEQFGTGFAIPEPETVEYKWFANGVQRPVLEVVTVAGLPLITRFHYDPEDISTGVDAAPGTALRTLSPNPAHDRCMISLEADDIVSIHGMDGRLVLRTRPLMSGSQWLDVGAIAPGTYIVSRSGDGFASRLVIAR